MVPAKLSSYLYPLSSPSPPKKFSHLLLEMVYYSEFSWNQNQTNMTVLIWKACGFTITTIRTQFTIIYYVSQIFSNLIGDIHPRLPSGYTQLVGSSYCRRLSLVDLCVKLLYIAVFILFLSLLSVCYY